MVGFGEAISRGFNNYFTFSGRATRAEYWWWYLFTTLVQMIPFIGGLIVLGVLIPSLSVTSRRLHDIGKSGWWQLVMFLGSMVTWGTFVIALIVGLRTSLVLLWIALVGLVAGLTLAAWWIRWLVRQGETGPNKYGQTHVRLPHNSLISLNGILAIHLLAP
jgi:uncharacterized membrane protein YhaH (DUF805 family)